MHLIILIENGYTGRKTMPYSEVCAHMRVAGKRMFFKLESDMIQLFDDDGNNFSSKITPSEAGVLYDDRGYYFHEEY